MGWKEDREYRWPRIPADSFRPNGRYREGLKAVEKLLDSHLMERAYIQHWERVVESGSTLPAATFDEARLIFRDEIRWMLIHESEWARIWSEGPRDWRSVLREYQAGANRDAPRIKAALAELERFDNQHAYLLRHAFWGALHEFLSDEQTRRVRRPDMNKEKGYDIVEVSGPRVRAREFQFISRLSFFRFSEMLEQWNAQIDVLFKPWPANWTEFGALRFDTVVTPRGAAKFRVAHLGLTAHLMARLRDFTAGYGIRSYATGQPIPDWGKPCWEIVADFVNAALSPDDPQSSETVRRNWQSFAKKHPVTLQGWPKPAIQESQTE